MHPIIGRGLAAIEKAEQFLLVIFLGTMIILAVYQILLRWFTSGGLVWIDPLLRLLVLWSGLLGAVYATSQNKHIAVNITDYVLPKSSKRWLYLLTSCFSTLVAAMLCRASLLFIASEIRFGGAGLFNIPTWIWSLIFPLAFALICLHFFIHTILAVQEIRGKGPSPGTMTDA